MALVASGFANLHPSGLGLESEGCAGASWSLGLLPSDSALLRLLAPLESRKGKAHPSFSGWLKGAEAWLCSHCHPESIRALPRAHPAPHLSSSKG